MGIDAVGEQKRVRRVRREVQMPEEDRVVCFERDLIRPLPHTVTRNYTNCKSERARRDAGRDHAPERMTEWMGGAFPAATGCSA